MQKYSRLISPTTPPTKSLWSHLICLICTSLHKNPGTVHCHIFKNQLLITRGSLEECFWNEVVIFSLAICWDKSRLETSRCVVWKLCQTEPGVSGHQVSGHWLCPRVIYFPSQWAHSCLCLTFSQIPAVPLFPRCFSFTRTCSAASCLLSNYLAVIRPLQCPLQNLSARIKWMRD